MIMDKIVTFVLFLFLNEFWFLTVQFFLSGLLKRKYLKKKIVKNNRIVFTLKPFIDSLVTLLGR